MAELAFIRFGEEGWEQYDSPVWEGRLTLEECARAQYGMLRAGSEDEILRAVRGLGQVRDGFTDLVERCEESAVPLVIASAGLDFIIEDILRSLGLGHVCVVCPKSDLRTDGIRVVFPTTFSKTGEGDFKDGVVRYLKERGDYVLYAGNGLSDMNAARRSDMAFVMRASSLEREYASRGYPFTPISDFWPVIEALKERAG